ncbi:hypothetical protein R9C00_03210 [Flammeovirgaceae bacterium SG7u.111]|nr:hypothetical protein [Flammeovirgaceae bacterium SG7u.132]WPO36451.1 hypothetical protein R9C00_03210 [Flammeovirgaceae bacterium SG7u.111]
MKKIAIFSILFTLLTLSVFAQGSFYDDMDGNSHGWYSTTDLNKTHFSSSSMWINIGVDSDKNYNGMLCGRSFDQYSDFTFESTQRLHSGSVGNGIIWNYSDNQNYMKFLITDRDQGYSVWEVVNGKSTALIPWSTNTSINKGFKTNTIKVKKTGSVTRFYVNGTEVGSKNIRYKGSKAGIFLGTNVNVKLQVEDFRYSLGRSGQSMPVNEEDNGGKPSGR